MSNEAVEPSAGETSVEPIAEQSGDSGDFSENLANVVAKAQGEPLEEEGKAAEKVEAEKPKDKKLAPKFIAIRKKAEEARARDERVRHAAAQLQAREAQVAAYEKQLQVRESKTTELEQLVKDPRKLIGWIQANGVSFEDLSVAAFADSDPAARTHLDVKRQAAEVAELRKLLEQRDEVQRREKEEFSARERTQYVTQQEKAFVAALQEPGFEVCDEAFGEDEQLRVAYHLNSLADKRGLGWGIRELAEATKEMADAGLTVTSHGEVVKNMRYERIRGRKPPTELPSGRALASAPRTITPSAASERSTESASLDELDWQTRTRIIAERARRLG
jgi:hypothetical protein